MIWMDYTVEQAGDHFRVKGDWDGEVMGRQRDGTDKGYHLYKPGDVFIVNENGWLMNAFKNVLKKAYLFIIQN